MQSPSPADDDADALCGGLYQHVCSNLQEGIMNEKVENDSLKSEKFKVKNMENDEKNSKKINNDEEMMDGREYAKEWERIFPRSTQIMDQLEKLLENDLALERLNVAAINKASRHYRTCVASFEVAHMAVDDGGTSRKTAEKYFAEFFRSSTPPSSFTSEPNSTSSFNRGNQKSFDLENYLGISHSIDVFPFVKLGDGYDEELKRNILSLDVGDLSYKGPKSFLLSQYSRTNKRRYIDGMRGIALRMGGNHLGRKWMDELWDTEVKLFKMSIFSSEDTNINSNINNNNINNNNINNNINSIKDTNVINDKRIIINTNINDDDNVLTSVENIQKLFKNTLDIRKLIRACLGWNVTDRTLIRVKNVKYITSLTELLSSLPVSTKVDLITLLTYRKLSSFVPLSTSAAYSLSSLSSSSPPLSLSSASSSSSNPIQLPRRPTLNKKHHCLSSTLQIYKFAVGCAFALEKSLAIEDEFSVASFFNIIKKTLLSEFLLPANNNNATTNNNNNATTTNNNNNIYNDTTATFNISNSYMQKATMKKKIETLKFKIISTLSNQDIIFLDQLYSKIEVSDWTFQDVFINNIEMRKSELENKAHQKFDWNVAPYETRPVYNVLNNEISIPIALLQDEFRQPGHLEFGSFGHTLVQTAIRNLLNVNDETPHISKKTTMLDKESSIFHLALQTALESNKKWIALHELNGDQPTWKQFYLKFMQVYFGDRCGDIQSRLQHVKDQQELIRRLGGILKANDEFSNTFNCE